MKKTKCSHLFKTQGVDTDIDISDMFSLQAALQTALAAKGKAVDPASASFKDKVDDITRQWRNMNMEMAELLERLPFKEWKTYSEEEKAGKLSPEEKLEIWYEYIDVFHFFLNIGLQLGIDGPMFKKLFVTKNMENLERLKKGY